MPITEDDETSVDERSIDDIQEDNYSLITR